VNTMLKKLKEKFEEEKREREDLNEIMQDVDATEPLTDSELEELLNMSD